MSRDTQAINEQLRARAEAMSFVDWAQLDEYYREVAIVLHMAGTGSMPTGPRPAPLYTRQALALKRQRVTLNLEQP